MVNWGRETFVGVWQDREEVRGALGQSNQAVAPRSQTHLKLDIDINKLELDLENNKTANRKINSDSYTDYL